ncbi:hypothetical protein [Deinococcus sp.]|uniref:hypothetical protein n=1 Tax=Deinococcus sp. TaxID=47478 RepID=UPI003B59A58B
MKRIVLLSLLAALLHTPAEALQVIVWDRDLQTKLGYGEVVSSTLNMQLVPDYSGPVVVLFARDDREKTTFSDLAARYDGVLRAGQLSLDVPGTPGSVTFSKFLGSFKLNLSLQSAGQSISLPGLKAAPDAVPDTNKALPKPAVPSAP